MGADAHFLVCLRYYFLHCYYFIMCHTAIVSFTAIIFQCPTDINFYTAIIFQCATAIIFYTGGAIIFLKTTRNCQHKALLSSSGPPAASKVSHSRIIMAEGRRLDGQPAFGVWLNTSLLCGTQVTRVGIDGGAVWSFIIQGPTVIHISSNNI